ncbi:hypothetical protein ACJMK2_005169 [Sinanodonta woodiana]|uniref:Upstream activation factor subunit spp27 n=1 Tax=Sinanodonta woodiana TaxID=1069815 RepID=A0ABD3VPK8_SINWO
MADINISDLKVQIKGILKNADLTTLSSKKIRKQLEEKFNADFTDRKKEIDDFVMELIAAQENADDDDDEEEETEDLVKQEQMSQNSSRQTEAEDQDMTTGSSADEEEEEEEEEVEPQKKKRKISVKVKEASKNTKPVQAAKSKPVKKSTPKQEKELTDEELAKMLQQEEDGGRRSRHRAVKKLPKHEKAEKKPRKKREGSSAGEKPWLLSPDLAAVMGKDKMPRTEVVKRMWEIVRERNLEDPGDRRYMICDEQLFKVFKKKRVMTFAMMKTLKFHIHCQTDIS